VTPVGARRSRVAVVAVPLACLLVSCTGPTPSRNGSQTSHAPVRPSATPRHSGAGPSVRLDRVATLDEPIAMAARPGDPALYLAQKGGQVVAIRGGSVDPAPVLDISGDLSTGSEEGLLGIAFSPNGRYLYASYTDAGTDSRLVSYRMAGGRADPATRRQVLFVKQPFTNHNGGGIAFGPDGYLYMGLGDGGSEGDPERNGQSLSTLLGKMLRIEPHPSGSTPYSIPPSNPFVDRQSARPEIWAYGLRNPWRFSFDRATGDLWIGDVGQNAWEEIDHQPASWHGGENYGWSVMEGDHRASGGPNAGMVRPVYEYSHTNGGCAVTGGYVYRGRSIPPLRGDYVFADFCRGRLQEIRLRSGTLVQRASLGPVVKDLSSFGQDSRGELYALSLDGGVYRLVPAGTSSSISPGSPAGGEAAAQGPTHRRRRRRRWWFR
jgi:glucose/arabinose dehydrogenase